MSRILENEQPALASGMLFRCEEFDQWCVVFDPDAGGRGVYAKLSLASNEENPWLHAVYEDLSSLTINATIESEVGTSRALACFQIRDVLRSTSESDLEQIRDLRYWRREEKRKMTVAEIEKALGYGIEIVKG